MQKIKKIAANYPIKNLEINGSKKTKKNQI
jgi:hypothetical protein